MAIESDVLVIGGGLAGLTAAIAATREGAAVRLVSATETTLGHASGLIDVLGYLPEDRRSDEAASPVADPFAAIQELPATHPYSIVGVSAVRAGLALFDEAAGDAYRGGHTDANALVPTHGGTVKPTARYPASAAAGLASDDRDTLFVGFERLPAFDAGVAADRLQAAGVPFETAGATIEFPVPLRDDAKVTRYAHLLDENDPVGDADAADAGIPLRLALADVMDRRREDLGAERVGFPAVLGEERVAAVCEDLAAALDADVFEVPMGPPSLPGMRLENLLYDALDAAGGRFDVGAPVVEYEASETSIARVFIDRGGKRIPVTADQFVLATGGLASDGIDSDRSGVREPVFDCHVAHPDDRDEWYADDAFGDHPFARFGVAVDEELRPLAAGGHPEFDNLRAAGAVLGNYDFAAEKSGSGVSLATGFVAGRGAAREVAG